MELVVVLICSALLVTIIATLCLSADFRTDMLGGEGEATVAGFISVKGVAVVLLSALLLGGMLFPLPQEKQQSAKGEQHEDATSSAIEPVIEADADNPGVELLSTDTTIDLRMRTFVPRAVNKESRLSPMIRDVEISAVRRTSESAVYVVEHASSSTIMDIVCISHNCRINHSEGTDLAGDDSRNKWTIIADISSHSLNIPFTLKYRAITWNAYQVNHPFSGFISRKPQESITHKVLLPDAMRVVGDITFEIATISDTPHWRLAPAPGFYNEEDNTIIWKVLNPRPESLYRFDWEWKSDE